MRSNAKIIVYTHKGCPGGDRALQFFQEHGIPIEVKDILMDSSALREFQERGGFATPLLALGDRIWIGFDEEEMVTVLATQLQENSDSLKCERSGG